MSHKESVPVTFWIIAAIALLWNLAGLYAFYTDMTMTQESLDALSEGHRGLYENFPIWKKVAYGAATIFGFLGSLGLVLKKSWAIPLLLISLVGVIVQNIHTFFMTNAVEVMGNMAIYLPSMVILIAAFLYYYAKKSAARGWIS